MAEKTTEKKVILERDYNVPLRKGWLKAPMYRRTKKAMVVLREFLSRHMKSDNVRIGMHLNEHMWKHGIRNPPHHVKVHVTKDEEGAVKAELEGFTFKEAVQAKPKEEKATGLKGKLQEALGSKDEKKEEEQEAEPEKAEPKKEEKKAEPKQEAKKEAQKKEETKSEKKPAKKKTVKTASNPKKKDSEK